MSNTVQTTNERTDERTKRRVSLCLLCLPGCPSYGGSGLLAMLHRNRNLRGMGEGRNPGLTNKYAKVGRLIIRKIIKITAIRCHILGLNTPNSIHGVCPSARPCLRLKTHGVENRRRFSTSKTGADFRLRKQTCRKKVTTMLLLLQLCIHIVGNRNRNKKNKM